MPENLEFMLEVPSAKLNIAEIKSDIPSVKLNIIEFKPELPSVKSEIIEIKPEVPSVKLNIAEVMHDDGIFGLTFHVYGEKLVCSLREILGIE